MEIVIELVTEPIEMRWTPPAVGRGSGAVAEFRGIVRGEENGAPITALRYEAYEMMARREITRLLVEAAATHPCERVVVWHRHGWIPVGEIAILVWVEARHRGPAFALLAAFMDRLKQDVPIWKVELAP